MNSLFVNERVIVTGDGESQWPHLVGIVGQVTEERRSPYYGRCAIACFRVGKRSEWIYARPSELKSIERDSNGQNAP